MGMFRQMTNLTRMPNLGGGAPALLAAFVEGLAEALENCAWMLGYNRCPRSFAIKSANRRAEEAIESLGILHHQEVPDPRHENHLNTVVIEGGYVGRSVIRIDRDHRQMQSIQGARHLSAVAER